MVYSILSKLLPIFVLPLGASLVILCLRIFWPRKRLGTLAFSILLFFSSSNISGNLVRLIERPWERIPASEAPKADAIVVLSGGGIFLRGSKRIVEWKDPDRFLAGIELYKAGRSKKLLFTGEKNADGKTSGQLYIKEAKKLGVPLKAMATTSLVFNTGDEARKIKELLDLSRKKKNHRVLLVTSAFHMSRAKREFEKQGLSVIAFPVDFKTPRGKIKPYRWVPIPIPNARSLQRSSFAIREMIGRLVYKLR